MSRRSSFKGVRIWPSSPPDLCDDQSGSVGGRWSSRSTYGSHVMLSLLHACLNRGWFLETPGKKTRLGVPQAEACWRFSQFLLLLCYMRVSGWMLSSAVLLGIAALYEYKNHDVSRCTDVSANSWKGRLCEDVELYNVCYSFSLDKCILKQNEEAWQYGQNGHCPGWGECYAFMKDLHVFLSL